jgi:hypothetical protein
VDALLLLADQGEPPDQRVLRIRTIDDLQRLEPDWRNQTREVQGRIWAHVFDEEAESLHAELQSSGSSVRLGSIASVDIGVVTGSNEFFVLPAGRMKELGIPDRFGAAIVERARDAKTLRVPLDSASLRYGRGERSQPAPTDLTVPLRLSCELIGRERWLEDASWPGESRWPDRSN